MGRIFDIKAGHNLFRVVKSNSSLAKAYPVYGLLELKEDLGLAENKTKPTLISTEENLPVLQGGELIMSLTSPAAVIVQPDHAGYVLSQNFIQIFPHPGVDPRYLLFLINESFTVKRQVLNSMQNSRMVEKISIKTLAEIQFPELPEVEIQEIIGEKYCLERNLRKLKSIRDNLKLKKPIEEMRKIADGK